MKNIRMGGSSGCTPREMKEIDPNKPPYEGIIMEEIRKGKPTQSIEVLEGESGTIKFARNLNRFALEAGGYDIKCLVHYGDNSTVKLFYMLTGPLHNTTVKELSIVGDLLMAKFDADFQDVLQAYEPVLLNEPTPIASFEKSAICLCVVLKLGKTPDTMPGFKEV